MPEGVHKVDGVVILDRPVVVYGARGSRAVLCVKRPPPRDAETSSQRLRRLREADPEEAARQKAAEEKQQRQRREQNLRARQRDPVAYRRNKVLSDFFFSLFSFFFCVFSLHSLCCMSIAEITNENFGCGVVS